MAQRRPVPTPTATAPPAEPAPASTPAPEPAPAPAAGTTRVTLLGPICGPDRYHDAGDVVELPAADIAVLLANHDVLPAPEAAQ